MKVSLQKIIEGRTSLFVPSSALSAREPPTTPVFFNPAARINRDVSVAVTGVLPGKTFCDSLAGIGSRGIRIASEVSREVHVTLVDFNELALKIARRNAKGNSVLDRCSFVGGEANTFLFSRFRRDSKFEFIDIDPFGTPVPYLAGGFNAGADGGVISVTATDTAVLCGVYPRVAERRYLSVPLKNEFKHETAIRILLNACRRIAAMKDIGIEPVVAHSTRHYVRVFLRMRVGGTRADRSARHEGFLSLCKRCGERTSSEQPALLCPHCGARVGVAGPIWVGPLLEPEVLRDSLDFCFKNNFVAAAAALRVMTGLNDLPPYGYSVEEVCSRLRVPSVSQATLMEKLDASGYKAMTQPFEKRGFKTDANYAVVSELVRSLSKEPGVPATPLHPRQR